MSIAVEYQSVACEYWIRTDLAKSHLDRVLEGQVGNKTCVFLYRIAATGKLQEPVL